MTRFGDRIGSDNSRWPASIRSRVAKPTPRVGPDLAIRLPTAFRAYSKEYFHENTAWTSMDRVLSANGGAYGLYGDRGAGKSWIMMNATRWATDHGGIGLWFPSPSEYEPLPFLSSLADNFANEVESRFLIYDRRRQAYSALTLISFVLAFVTATVLLSLQSYTITSWLPATIILAVLTYATVQFFLLSRGGGYSGTSILVRRATALRERIRYSAVLNSGSGVSLSSPRRLLSWNMTLQRGLSERPTTISSVIFDLRALIEQASVVLRAPIVIAIDELDKMQDGDALRRLLSDVKAIFDTPGAHFLVSVSDEAVGALLASDIGIIAKDVFSSSFYSVIEVAPLSPSEGAALIADRSHGLIPGRMGRIIAVFGGGNRRDVVRLTESLLCESTQLPLDDVMVRLIVWDVERSVDRFLDRDGATLDGPTMAYGLEIATDVRRARWAVDASVGWDGEASGAMSRDQGETDATNRRDQDISFDGSALGSLAGIVRKLQQGGTNSPLSGHPSWLKIVVRLFVVWVMLAAPAVVEDEFMMSELMDIVRSARRDPAMAYRRLVSQFSKQLDAA